MKNLENSIKSLWAHDRLKSRPWLRLVIEDLKKLRTAIIQKHYAQCTKMKYRISDLGIPFSVGNLSKEQLSDSGAPCILYGELFTTYGCVIDNISSRTTATECTTTSACGDLLFPASTTVDALSLIAPSAINVEGIILGGDMFGIHISPKFDSCYLSYYFNFIAKTELAKYAKGSTIIHLHYADIKEATVLVPTLDEQKRISETMMAVESKIINAKRMMECYNSLKKYMLQKMFI